MNNLMVIGLSLMHMIFSLGTSTLTQAEKRFILDGKPLILPNGNNSPYRSNGSLTFYNRQFYLGGKPLRIISGSFHYFRAVPEYWRHILLKMNACGLNTVQTYVPWNLHEEHPGNFNFQGRLNLRKFVQTAHEVGLYVIFRPGPFICAEWDYGGMPSWLLKDNSMRVRSNYPGYIQPVERYFTRLLREVADLQYSRGGPIIAIQVENEFGSYSNETDHLMFLKKLLLKNGMNELFLTSDGFFNKTHNGMERAPFYREALTTANFDNIDDGYKLFNIIGNLSTDFPLMVTEFWSGWFDQWKGPHHTVSPEKFGSTLKKILEKGASVNFYMFYSGTNFGFMSGANWVNKTDSYYSDVTSYDYDGILSEAGDVTAKYNATRELIKAYVLNPGDRLPDPPADLEKANYGTLLVTEYIDFDTLKRLAKIYNSTNPLPMELLPLHSDGLGQNFGFTLYSTTYSSGKILNFTSLPKDRAQIYVDGEWIDTIESWTKNLTVVLPQLSSQGLHSLEILVENRGRVNFMLMGFNQLNEQRKGILSDVLLDNKVLHHWSIQPFEFSTDYINRANSLTTWTNTTKSSKIPALYRTVLQIDGEPKDTFLWMKGWSKGNVLINGFNIGRYWDYGPQQTLYVPGPLLKRGNNDVSNQNLE